MQITNFLSLRCSQNLKACHTAYTSALYILIVFGSVQECEALLHSALGLRAISVHSGMIFNVFWHDALRKEFQVQLGGSISSSIQPAIWFAKQPGRHLAWNVRLDCQRLEVVTPSYFERMDSGRSSECTMAVVYFCKSVVYNQSTWLIWLDSPQILATCLSNSN